MQLTEFLLLVIGVLNFALAVSIVSLNRKNPINIWFGIFAGSLLLWPFALVGFRMVGNEWYDLLFLKCSYLAVMASAGSFYVFTHYFPERTPFSWIDRSILGLGTIVVAGYIISPGILITGVTVDNGVKEGIQEVSGFIAFSVYFLNYFFGSLTVLFKRWRRSAVGEQTPLGFLLWSILIAGLLGVYFNLFLPSPVVQEWRFTWTGPIFTAIIVVAVSYAMARYRLFNARLIATEVFAVMISLTSLFDVFIPTPLEFRIVKIVLFLAVSLVGYLLVRSVLREIKDKERIEALASELGRANQELKKLDAAKSEFISIASHQLRAPLTVIKGYVSLLLEGSLGAITDQTKDAMHKVAISAEQLVKLIADMLDLSRIEGGRLKYDMKPTLVDDIVDEAVKEFEINAKAKGLQFVYENRNTAQKPVQADPDKIREVVVNLIDNAIKYTAQGRVSVELYTESREGRPWLTLKVQDNGIGISSVDIAKMFTKFGRTEEARKVRPDGMGLGLYLVKKIIDDHGGRVWVESPGLGQGSAFFVQIPA